jgi:undecaprenyl-diphosphatase
MNTQKQSANNRNRIGNEYCGTLRHDAVGQPRSNPTLDAIVAAAATLAFIALAVAVAHGATQGFDIAVREAIHSLASVPLTRVMQFVTMFGGSWFLWPLGLLTAVGLAQSGRRRSCTLFAIAVLGAAAVDESMKLIFHRPRPEAYFGYPSPVTYSFPSGHSFVSFCFYLTLAEILTVPDWPLARKLALWICAATLVLLIGFSRVYLGVHYPTDVIAGYTGAIAWTAIVRAAHHRWWN